jgi:hypothetical protein
MSAPDELRQLAGELEHRATQNAIVRSYRIMPSSRPEDDDLDRAAAVALRHHANLVGWKHRAQRAEAEARQLREAIRAHENLHRPDGPDGADGPIEMDGWPCCNDDRLLWAAAVAEGAEDRGQTDG